LIDEHWDIGRPVLLEAGLGYAADVAFYNAGIKGARKHPGERERHVLRVAWWNDSNERRAGTDPPLPYGACFLSYSLRDARFAERLMDVCCRRELRVSTRRARCRRARKPERSCGVVLMTSTG
jgi:hypothetical protein